MRTASGITIRAIVRNWRARNASAPSWMALAISRILGVPWSAARTPRAKNTPAMMPTAPATRAKINQAQSLPVRTKAW